MRKKKIEASKVIIGSVILMTAVVVIFSMYMMWLIQDVSTLSYLIPAVFTELTATTGFYYSKAKAENRIKLRKKYGAEIYNDAKENDY